MEILEHSCHQVGRGGGGGPGFGSPGARCGPRSDSRTEVSPPPLLYLQIGDEIKDNGTKLEHISIVIQEFFYLTTICS